MKRKKIITFRINFITLTLAEQQSVNDEYIKNRLLQPFIKWLLRKGATAYLWKAETQNNGNIHFHIITNIYIPWRDIRTKWNSLQQDHGFLNNYQNEFGSYDPNGTDVHSVYKHVDLINNVGSYFGKLDEWCKRKGTKAKKEFTEHPSRWLTDCSDNNLKFPVPKRQVEGRKWAVSNNLTNVKCYIDDESLRSCEFEEVFNHFTTKTKYKYMKRDFADIYIYDEQQLFRDPHPLLIEKLSDLYNEFVTTAPKP